MSEAGNVQRLTFPGLLSALLLLGCGAGLLLGGGAGSSDARAASLHQPVSSIALAERLAAQAGPAQTEEQQDGPASAAAPPGAGEAAGPGDAEDRETAEDEVPFSELNEALTAARSRLAELTKAAEIAKVAGELREKLQTAESENRQLKSVLSQLQTENSELQSDKQTAERRIKSLEEASQAAAAEAKRLDEELVSMRWQNSQLSNSLAQAETIARERTEELDKARADLGARAESLALAAEESATQIADLQRDLDTAREQILIAEREKAESEAALAELKQNAEESISDSARLARDLDGTITELADTREQLVNTEDALDEAKVALDAAERETDVLREQLAGNRSEADQLRARLEAAEADLENVQKLNAGLEQQVDLLKTAAGEATDAARQNLLAVENQINEINAALASVKADELLPPGTGGPVADASDVAAASSENGAQAAAQPSADGWVPRPSPPRSSIQQDLVVAAASEIEPAAPPATSPLAGTEPPGPRGGDREAPSVDLASLATDLPADRRKDALNLLGKLKAEKDPRGLSMTVPGAQLFAVNSEEIEPSAFEALANVAELVDLYDQRDVLIIGHTDAVGDADYNQQLSERRAALVKKFFVEEFEISGDRLRIEGKGEQDPISSNATADGRNANRRVEVVILE